MNPVLIIIGLILIVFLWALLAFIFKPLGNIISKIFGDAIDIMKNKEEEEKKDEDL